MQFGGMLAAQRLELGVRHFAGEVEVAGSIEIQLRREVGDRQVDDPFDRDVGGIAVVRVALEFDALAGDPAHQPIGPVARAWLQAGRPRVDGGGDRQREQGGQVGHRPAEANADGQRIDGIDAFDGLQQSGAGRHGAGGQRKPQAGHEMLGGEWVAVRPAQARPEVEDIGESAVVDRPGSGRPRDDRAVGRLRCHAFVKIARYRDGRVVFGQLRVERRWIGAEASAEGGGGGDRAAAAPSPERKDCRRLSGSTSTRSRLRARRGRKHPSFVLSTLSSRAAGPDVVRARPRPDGLTSARHGVTLWSGRAPSVYRGATGCRASHGQAQLRGAARGGCYRAPGSAARRDSPPPGARARVPRLPARRLSRSRNRGHVATG